MTLTLEDGLYIEQLALVAFSITTFALFISQWQAEGSAAVKPSSSGRTNVKFRLHRMGILATLLLMVVSVDPFGARNILPPLTVSWVGANTTAIFVGALAFLNQTAVEVVYLSKLRKVPVFLAVLTWLALGTMLVLANVSYFLVLRTNRWWYSAIDLFYTAAVLLAVVVSFVATAFQILDALDASGSRREARSSRRNKAKRRQMIWRAVTVSLIGAAVVPLHIYAGVDRVRDRGAPVAEPDLDTFRIRDRAFVYGHVLATLVLLWYSWVPSIDKKKAGYQRVDTFDSRSRASSASRSGRYRSGSDVSAFDDPASNNGWKSATHRRLRGASESVSTSRRGAASDDEDDMALGDVQE